MTILEQAAALYSSAEEVRQIANLSHSIPGAAFIIVALIMLVAGFGYKKKLLTYIYAGFLFSFTLIFTLAIFFNKGLGNALNVLHVMLYYPEISIHLIQSAAAIIGSLIELLYLKKIVKSKLALLAFPFIFIVIGYTNVLHPHGPVHDEVHTSFHSLLGGIMILAGIFLLIGRLYSKMYSRVFLSLGVLSIITFSYLLIIYRESPNAYEYAFPRVLGVQKYDFLQFGDSAVVYIYQDYVAPQFISIKKGGKVSFVLADNSWHDIASGPHPTHTNYPPLNIGFLKNGEIKSTVFPKTGHYGFHDHIHENFKKLQGVIRVTD